MQAIQPTAILEQPFQPVKSKAIIDTSPSPDSMIHHKASTHRPKVILDLYRGKRGLPYGVSLTYRVLSKGLLLKKWDYVVDCLRVPLGLTTKQRAVTLELLRLWAYYGKVYPKESQITEDSWTSKATFWRTIRLLEELGLVQRVNRYVLRPHAQISNLYQLHRLVVVLARYLCEHTGRLWPGWLWPYLSTPWPQFWGFLTQSQEARAGPLAYPCVYPGYPTFGANTLNVLPR